MHRVGHDILYTTIELATSENEVKLTRLHMHQVLDEAQTTTYDTATSATDVTLRSSKSNVRERD